MSREGIHSVDRLDEIELHCFHFAILSILQYREVVVNHDFGRTSQVFKAWVFHALGFYHLIDSLEAI